MTPMYCARAAGTITSPAVNGEATITLPVDPQSNKVAALSRLELNITIAAQFQGFLVIGPYAAIESGQDDIGNRNCLASFRETISNQDDGHALTGGWSARTSYLYDFVDGIYVAQDVLYVGINLGLTVTLNYSARVYYSLEKVTAAELVALLT